MCIIITKEKGIQRPTDEVIKNCWVNNTDGAGFMYNKAGKVYIEKGFMTLKALKTALQKAYSEVDVEATSFVYHFRITTHGGTTPDNTHPFPISDHIGTLKKLTNVAPIGVAHNGIISITPRSKTISDTMEWIAQVLSPVYLHANNFYRHKHLMKLLENTLDSKLAILNGAGEIYTIGAFNIKNGLKFSNYSYEAYTYKWSKNYTYGGIVDEETPKVVLAQWLDSRDVYVGVNNNGYKERYIADGFLLGEDGLVYEYDYQIDKLILMEGAKAYYNDGEVLAYDMDEGEYMEVMDASEKKNYYFSIDSGYSY